MGLIVAITLVGAYLRFHMLGVRSLWPAECFSVLLAWERFPMFVRHLWWGEANMAFYYLLMRGWVHISDAEVWVESLSAIFGVLAIPTVYLLGKRFLGTSTGLIAAALLAVHSSHIEHSEQMRSYSLWVLLVIPVTYYFLLLIEFPERKRTWLLYALFAVLLIYTQVFGIFLLAAQWLAITPRYLSRLGLWKILMTIVAIGAASVPMAIVMLFRDSGQLDWVPAISVSGVWEVFRNIVGTDTFSRSYLPAVITLSVLYIAAWGVAISKVFTRPRPTDEQGRVALKVLAWSLIFPLVIMTIASFRRPIVYPRYLLMSVPAAVLLAAYGTTVVARSVKRGHLLTAFAFATMIAIAFLGDYKFDGETPKAGNDWRRASRYILQREEPGDAVVFYNFSGGWAFDYYSRLYREHGGHGPTPPVLFPLTFERSSLERRFAPYHRVWLVLQQTMPNPVSNANDALLRDVLGKQFQLANHTQFAGERMFPNENVTIDFSLYKTR